MRLVAIDNAHRLARHPAVGSQASHKHTRPDCGGDYDFVEVGTDCLLISLMWLQRRWLGRRKLFFIFLVLFLVILILAITAGHHFLRATARSSTGAGAPRKRSVIQLIAAPRRMRRTCASSFRAGKGKRGFCRHPFLELAQASGAQSGQTTACQAPASIVSCDKQIREQQCHQPQPRSTPLSIA